MISRPTKYFALSLLSLLIACVSPAATQHQGYYYLDPASVDLAHLLPPPPVAGSSAGQADLAAVVEAQHSRSADDSAAAINDGRIDLFQFAGAVGPGFTPARLPFATQFFAHFLHDEEQAVEIAKAAFNRPRPFVADPEIAPLIVRPGNAAYPSGHATFAYATAVILAQMAPEKAPAIFARADEFAQHRVVAGVHYPADIAAGKSSGIAMDTLLLHDPQFRADFLKARAEVRQAVGLP